MVQQALYKVRCHGLVPWRLTFAAEVQALVAESFKRETPGSKPVASQKVLELFLAASVSLHGTRPWHPIPYLIPSSSMK